MEKTTMNRTASNLLASKYGTPFAIPEDAEVSAVFINILDLQNEREIKIKEEVRKV